MSAREGGGGNRKGRGQRFIGVQGSKCGMIEKSRVANRQAD